LAAECPTIASAVGGLPDVVVDGETGWLVPPRDSGTLAASILEVLGDRHEGRRRARAGRDLVRHLFDVRRTAGEIASIYRTVTGETERQTCRVEDPGCTLASNG
jgi:glycosyltransferase involved in cell wall biosynthesis